MVATVATVAGAVRLLSWLPPPHAIASDTTVATNAAVAAVAPAVPVSILSPMPIIVTENLTQTYLSAGRPLTVLHDINLAIEAQRLVAVVGPSGSGKTTLLGLLAGLDRPTTGTIRIDGQDLGALDEDGRAAFRARRVGFVFQTFQLLPTLTAFENVLVPLELRPGGREAGDDERAHALLERVGLADRAHHYPGQLSGGEQQRVGLARAFANRPSILFADEPTGSLDAETGADVIDLLVELNAEAKTTMVLVTHDPALAARAHRVIQLRAGVIVGDEPSA
jgi:putative ABC transport system ATP-binding protein